MSAKVCFNCANQKLVDGSFDGGIVFCQLKGCYKYLESPGCADFKDRHEEKE